MLPMRPAVLPVHPDGVRAQKSAGARIGDDLNRTNHDPVAFQNDRIPQAALRIGIL